MRNPRSGASKQNDARGKALSKRSQSRDKRTDRTRSDGAEAGTPDVPTVRETEADDE